MLHDWITNNVYYDPTTSYYGADMILRGYGLCDGYSKAYMMMLEKAGIPAERCVGEVVDGGENVLHGWNIIFLDGSWYYVDPTWDDPVDTKNPTKKVTVFENHLFFCLDEWSMSLAHKKLNYFEGINTYNIETPNSLEKNYYIVNEGWKTMGISLDQSGILIPLITEIAQTYEGGNAVYYVAYNTPVAYRTNDETAVDDSFILLHIIAYALENTPLILSDGAEVRVVTEQLPEEDSEHSFLFYFYGWFIEETGLLKLPKGLKQISSDSFSGVGATRVDIPAGCTKIESGAFANSAVRAVLVPDSLNDIDADAFANCERIVFFINNNPYVWNYAAERGWLALIY